MNPEKASREAPEETIGETANGLRVYFNPVAGHASTHFAHHPKLRAAVECILPTIEAKGDIMRLDRDTGEEVGTTDLVETTENDEVFYAKRPLRESYTRFVRGKEPAPTRWITIDLRKRDDGAYQLYTAYVGKIVPSFPGGNVMPEQSRNFWSNHALIFGSQEIVLGTETVVCPW